jgi:hypothetical protein
LFAPNLICAKSDRRNAHQRREYGARRRVHVREEFIMRQGLIPVSSPPPDALRRFVAGEIVRLGDIVGKTRLAGSE